MEKSRIAFYDNCRFALIILVVLGHFLDQNIDDSSLYRSIFLFIYSFHMPLFFYISGLFDKPGSSAGKRINKAIYYFSIYFLLKIFIAIVKFIFTGKVSFALFTENGIPWYCFVLGVFVLLTGLLFKAKVNIKVFLILSIILACFAGFDASIGDFLCLSRVIVFYPFYLAGVITPREKLENIISKRYLRICGLIVLIAAFAACIIFLNPLYSLRPLFTGRNPFSAKMFPYGPLLRLLCYVISCIVGFAFMLVIPQRNLGKITEFGSRTMQVYFWHRQIIFVLVYLNVNDSILSIGKFGKVLWILIAVALTFILSIKIFSFPTDNIQRGLKRENP